MEAMFKKGQGFVKKIALERIYRLFELADRAFESHPERSRRYVELARKISERNKARIPQELKKNFCKKCGAFLKEGKNSRLEKKGDMLIVTCLECGKVRFVNLKKS